MLDLLVDNPLLTLLAIIAVGSLVGRIKVGSVSLGVSAVLFTGMAASAVEPRLALPEIVYLLGLSLFVYTIGLEAGQGFLQTLRRGGLAFNLIALAVLSIAAGEAVALGAVFDLEAGTVAGTYTGALTNTPALAGVLDALTRGESPASAAEQAQPVVGYSLAYPIGVLGIIAPMALLQWRWRIDHAAEALASGIGRPIEHAVVRVTRSDGPEVRSIGAATGTAVEVSRLESGGRVAVARPRQRLAEGDLATLIGDDDELDKAARWLGVRLEQPPSRAVLDYRRMFVSNPDVVGRSLRELALRREHGFAVTRIRRGDVDLVAHSDSVLQLGDRVRVVAPTEMMRDAEALFGDSYRTVSEMDVLTFALGLSMGLALGLVPIPLPGGGELRLGSAGGPLVVSLALSAIGRSGPFVWQIPYGVNHTLRQAGVVLFLAGVGSRAGEAFVDAFSDPDSLLVLATGAVITLGASVTLLLVGHSILRLPFGQLMGMTAGVHTQPAALAYANEQAANELPNVGYAAVFPMAMIGKIVLAQVVLALAG